jgi:hypothetical protein
MVDFHLLAFFYCLIIVIYLFRGDNYYCYFEKRFLLFFLYVKQSNAGISSSSSPFTGGQRGSVPSVPSSLRVVAVNSNRDRNGSVLTETTRKDVRDGAASSSSVIDVDSKSTVAPGGPHDVYGEDAATEEQVVTPWFVSVAR